MLAILYALGMFVADLFKCSREVPKQGPQTNYHGEDFSPGPNQGRNTMDVLKATNFGNLGQKKAGKVRDIYDQGDKLILIATDRHSSFDALSRIFRGKGRFSIK